MTKQHFIRAAQLVSSINDGALGHNLGQAGPIETELDGKGNVSPVYVRAVWTAEAFIILFREYNPRFNEQKFLKACGLGGSDAR